MAKVGDVEEKSGIKTTVTNIDPETGQISWDVEYTVDYLKLFKEVTDMLETAKEVALATDEPFFKDHYNDVRKLKNQLRTYLRNNKAKEYARLKGMNEQSTSGDAGAFLTKNAFNKNKKANGTASNYYYKMGWKPVNQKKLNKQAKGIEVKHLFEK